MEHGNGEASFAEMIEELIVAGRTLKDTWTFPQNMNERVEETSNRAAQVNKWFIRLPWRLFEATAPLPGKALAVYMVAWREGCMQASAEVTMTSRILCRYSITRHEKALALACLVDKGLITVTRRRGKNPQITVLALVGRFGQKSRGA